MSIQNVVFDIGNVLVHWDPQAVVRTYFGSTVDVVDYTTRIFSGTSDFWRSLNLGHYTEAQAIRHYHQDFELTIPELTELVHAAYRSLVPLPESVALLEAVHEAQIPLYSITDNVHEIMAYLKTTCPFLSYFKDIVVSADLGILKPNPKIYQTLLKKNSLTPAATVFIDDLAPNVIGAQKIGMHGIQFQKAADCRLALQALGLSF